MLAKSPSAVRVMDGPAPIFCEALAGIVAKAIRMAPFVAGFVSAAIDEGSDAVAPAEAVCDPLLDGLSVHVVGIHSPRAVVGDLLKSVRIVLAHVVA